MTLTLTFQGQIWNLLYLNQKWSDCHETESRHIDLIQGLKCDHRVWPWPWSWPWISKVKYMICYISAKNGPIATKRDEKCRLNSRPQMFPSGFTLAMTLTLNFQGQIWNLLYLSQKWSDCHKTKSKHINWTHQWSKMWLVGLTLTMTLTLNFEGQMWPWPLTTHMTLTIDFHGQILK